MGVTMIDATHCDGCRDDFYNGKNTIGVKVCWMRKDAKLASRLLIHIDQMPPYLNVKTKTVPTCYRKPRFVTVKPEAIGPDGYWK
jgi:hypothetical protein